MDERFIIIVLVLVGLALLLVLMGKKTPEQRFGRAKLRAPSRPQRDPIPVEPTPAPQEIYKGWEIISETEARRLGTGEKIYPIRGNPNFRTFKVGGDEMKLPAKEIHDMVDCAERLLGHTLDLEVEGEEEARN